jgi:hypothetical protein
MPVEAPRPDLSYRGRITLNSGIGGVDIDMANGMSVGTFAALCQNPQVFLNNETNFDRIKVHNQQCLR